MSLSCDKNYTDAFHSPGIEPWITGFLESKGFLGKVLDVGCGLGFSALILKLYIGNVEYLVGIDISPDKISKARSLNLYDELYVADIRSFNPETKFDTLIALEVLHGLPAETLNLIESLIREGGSIVIALSHLPRGISVSALINSGYKVYRYMLRGLVLIDLKGYRVYLVRNSRFLRAIGALLRILSPILKVTRTLEKGYLLVFK